MITIIFVLCSNVLLWFFPVLPKEPSVFDIPALCCFLVKTCIPSFFQPFFIIYIFMALSAILIIILFISKCCYLCKHCTTLQVSKLYNLNITTHHCLHNAIGLWMVSLESCVSASVPLDYFVQRNWFLFRVVDLILQNDSKNPWNSKLWSYSELLDLTAQEICMNSIYIVRNIASSWFFPFTKIIYNKQGAWIENTGHDRK